MSEFDDYTNLSDPTTDDTAALGDLAQLLRLWRERCEAGRLPARAAFDPFDMRKLLGRIVLLDVLEAPLRFRFRLVGTDWVARFGLDPTNTFVDDFPRVQSRAFIRDVMTKVATGRQPLMVRRSVIIEGEYFRYGMLLLPLATDGSTVDMIMMGFDFPDT
ncbi:PAS domain-containing protein [Dongia rigui]|uniref:PAS domain-containing protein n=1 Tax=Dongia rigui TaxID=940149 RepID=A0ABU5E1U8_9PROT|nr:PAS domain-containing protein [Dongia rigui]MDY0873185.1 PAS domain-containing protein [Dongia rigui]